MAHEQKPLIRFEPKIWVNPDGSVSDNIPVGHVIVNEYEERDGVPVLVGQYLAAEGDAN